MSTDILIAGGGAVGRTIAIALATSTHLRPVLLAGPPRREDHRASAISAAGRNFLDAIGVFPLIADEAQPIERMVITDSASDDLIRPEVLHFGGDAGCVRFAHMVPNEALDSAIDSRCAALGIEEVADSVRIYDEDETGITARLAGGGERRGALLVAADGRGSRLRAIAGIGTVEHAYRQHGIVGTLSHERPHEGTATQHFLPNGPFAMLPLKGNRSSIVWTEREPFARSLAAMDPFMAALEIERVFGLSLGRLTVEGPLQTYPLKAVLARDYAAGRLVLAGDAAHVIHPLAGQGLNLGLRDAAALAETLGEAHRLGEDLRAAPARYARWRRADAAQMAMVTDVLNTIFSQKSDILRAVRSIGTGLVERRQRLKAMFINEAAGLAGEVPRLMRGEAL